LKPGDELSFPAPVAFLLQDVNIWEMIQGSALTLAVMGVLLCFSIYSWTIIFAKSASLHRARKTNDRFLRAFRKSSGLEAVMVVSERYRPCPLVTVFDFGYEEAERQVRARSKMTNRPAVERALQLGISEEMTRLERNMNWLATTATASPFIGLLGTVLGIIRAFMDLSQQASTSLHTVGPGIAEALIATAVGLMAAIPAAIFYNLLSARIRDVAARMDDFGLEFLNMVERGFGD
jgi:biopolymer transport protein TolQ